MGAKENMPLMMTLDDAWNNKDWETFKKRHAANVAVYWPGQPGLRKRMDVDFPHAP